MQALRTIVAFLLLASASSPAAVQNFSADLALSPITTASPPYTVGQSLTFHLFVTNAGPSTAERVAVSMTTGNLNIQTIRGLPGCATLPCTVPSLRPKQSLPIDIIVNVSHAGTFFLGAHVTALGADPNPSNNQVDFSGSTQSSPSQTPAASNPGATPSHASKVPGPPHQLPPAATVQPTNTETQTGERPAPIPPRGQDHPADKPPAGNIYKPPPSARAPVLVATLAPSGPYHAGQRVTIVVTLNGTNPRLGQAPQLSGDASNLDFAGANVGCILQPCSMEAMEATSKTSYKRKLVATVVARGSFRYIASVAGAQRPAVVSGIARPRSGIWFLASALLLGIAAVLLPFLRHSWWRSRIAVDAHIHWIAGQASCTPLAFSTPAVHLSVVLPPGVASPGPLTLSRKQVLHA